MKRLLALVLVALFVASVTYAGDAVVAKPKAGDKAVLFTFEGFSNLGAGSFGGGIGGLYYFSDKFAGRLGIGFATSTETTKNPASTVPPGQKSERDETETRFSVAPALLYVFASSGPVNAYGGAQVLFVTRSTSEDDPGFDADSKVETSSTGFGAGLILGVEWFPWESVSFGAEYTFGFLSESSDRTVTVNGSSNTTDGPSTTSFGTEAVNSAHLTVAVYF